MLIILGVYLLVLVGLNSAWPIAQNNTPSSSNSRSSGLSSLDVPLWPHNDGYCRKSTLCVSHNHSTCFGVPLPYTETSPHIVLELFAGKPVELKAWERLRHVPKCWAALQPFLCALYMPKCENNLVHLPSQERCRYTMSTCRILNEPVASFLSNINCDRVEQFPPTCKNDVKDIRSNLSGSCIPPLVATDNTESHYSVVDGCGLQCEDPLVTSDEHNQIHKMIAWGATLSLACNLFAVLTFLIEWRSGNKYPALIIFYINVCFLISNMGWLIQFIPNARDDIVCKKDMTLRKSEPSAGENLSCVIVFVIVYYFLMAACVWFVILTYAWYLSFQALGKIQERIDKKGAYFHLVSWSLPVVLTISTMALREIDGNSIAGICFVSSLWPARVGLVIIPVTSTLLVGGYFLSRGLPFLLQLKRDSQQVLSVRASAKIRHMIVRIFVFSLFCMLFVMVTVICHVYEFQHHDQWQLSLRNYIFCLIMATESDQCKMGPRPSVAMIQLHLLALFVAGIVMSSWVWTSSTVDTWKRFLNRVFNKDVQEPIILKKHKIIARAFAKRKELNNAGKLEISIHNTHTDPVGLNLELNSTASHLSSNWMAAFPRLVDRRGALINVTTESNSSKRRNSCDSESYTYSVRRVSLESRRHSLDSQISLQISELTATHKTTPRASHHSHHGHHRSRGKRRRKEFSRNRRHQNVTRRGSSTSQESQLGIQILTAAAMAMNNTTILPNLLKRRPGNAGLDHGDVHLPLPGMSDEGDLCPSDGEQSNASDDALCPPGQGIQALDQRGSDSDDVHQYTDLDEDESAQLGRIYRRERALSGRLSSKTRELEYHKKAYKPEKKCKEYVSKAMRQSKSRASDSLSGRRKKTQEEASLLGRTGRQHAKIHKSEDRKSNSASDFEGPAVCKRSSGSKTRNRNSVALQKSVESRGSRGSRGSGQDELMLGGSDSEYEGCSKGTQVRAGSSRSKRSLTVDAATQISTQEMATQTDPHDYRSTTTQSTSTQGTQMTPPYHIRLINKTLGGNGHSTQLRENHSYISLTDAGSDAYGK